MDERLIAIATRVARPWRWHPDHDDLRQVALIAAWQHADEPAAHIGRCAKLAIIDEVRRLNGRPGRARHGAERLMAEPPELTDEPPELRCSIALGLTGRTARLVDALVAGRTKQAIAADLGVTPSAVSHQLTAIRPVVADALHGA